MTTIQFYQFFCVFEVLEVFL